MKKSWKDALLSSGIPLEHTVAGIFRKLKLDEPIEFKYLRNNELGVSTVFSIDLQVSHIYLEHNMWVDYFVECKYRHDSVNWVFTPEEKNWRNFEFDASDMFNVIDNVSDSLYLNLDKFGFSETNYTLCNKGIELTTEGSNPKSIMQAIQQLAYAVGNQAPRAIEHQLEGMLGRPGPVWSLTPILVTTAQLWRIKPAQSLEMIRDASKLEDIADKCDSLVLHEPPDNLLRAYTNQKFASIFSAEQHNRLNKLFKAAGKNSFDFFIDVFSTYHPSYFLICHVSAFEQEVKGIMRLFDDETAIVKRPNEKIHE
jgi:hypothetical protein